MINQIIEPDIMRLFAELYKPRAISRQQAIEECANNLCDHPKGHAKVKELLAVSPAEVSGHILMLHLSQTAMIFYGSPIYDIQVAAIRGINLDPIAHTIVNRLVGYNDADFEMHLHLKKYTPLISPQESMLFDPQRKYQRRLIGTLNYMVACGVVNEAKIPWEKIEAICPNARQIGPESDQVAAELGGALYDQIRQMLPSEYAGRDEAFIRDTCKAAMGVMQERDRAKKRLQEMVLSKIFNGLPEDRMPSTTPIIALQYQKSLLNEGLDGPLSDLTFGKVQRNNYDPNTNFLDLRKIISLKYPIKSV